MPDYLKPPATYQGAKVRLAPLILDRVGPLGDTPFYDLCCGSGAVTIEAVKRGADPAAVTMVDSGPWAVFWSAVGAGSLDLARLADYAAALPSEPTKVADGLRELATLPASVDTAEVFTLLQAGSFGGKPVQIGPDGRWKFTPRAFYQSATARCATMMPLAPSVVARSAAVSEALQGVSVLRTDASTVAPPSGAVVYIDPPYQGTTGYGANDLRVDDLANRLALSCQVFVSEARPVLPHAEVLSEGRLKGGMSGARRKPNAEWLSWNEGAVRPC